MISGYEKGLKKAQELLEGLTVSTVKDVTKLSDVLPVITTSVGSKQVRKQCIHLQWDPSIPDTSGPERTVLVLVVKDVLWQSIVNHLVSLVCVHIRGVCVIQVSGLEGCPQFM